MIRKIILNKYPTLPGFCARKQTGFDATTYLLAAHLEE
jgi:hypothetical protein